MNFMNVTSQLNSRLILPEAAELRRRLQEKQAEYNHRIEEYRKKYEVKKLGLVIDRDRNMLDAIYKSELIGALLKNGEVVLRDVHDSLREEFNGYVAEEIFLNAAGVITDYIRTGGKHTHGGSGFFNDQMFRRLLQEQAVMVMPEGPSVRSRVQEKYYEYLGRNVDFENRTDTTVDRAAMKRNSYRIRILSELMAQHRLVVESLVDEIQTEEGKAFDRVEFYNAAAQLQELLSQVSAD